ncbi:MAG TPA: hypothetical protein ENH19_00615 [Actinobacteria bacterium]|nr:hypothetical protein [Actinomycetes bacterium]HEX21138.1 hypothetical protein [Actinomycetota bacterium]
MEVPSADGENEAELRRLGIGLLLIIAGYLNFFLLWISVVKGRYPIIILFIVSLVLISAGVWRVARGWRQKSWFWRFYSFIIILPGLFGLLFAIYIIVANIALIVNA